MTQNDIFSDKEKRNAYLAEAINYQSIPDSIRVQFEKYVLGAYREQKEEKEDDPISQFIAVKKYKPVALKVKPIYAELPSQYRIKREITGDPLAEMPQLNPNPPDLFLLEGILKKEKMIWIKSIKRRISAPFNYGAKPSFHME